MKKLTLTTLTVLIILVSTAGAALGQASGAPQEDAYVRTTSPDSVFNSQVLSVVSSAPACGLSDTTFLKWDLSSIPVGQTIASATLTLTTTFLTGAGSAQLTLYKAGDLYSAGPNIGQPWTETGLTSNNAPVINASADALETKAAPGAVGQTLVFNSAALASYLNSELGGDQVASLAIRVTGGCVVGVAAVQFASAEAASGGPTLQLQNPTAVRLVELSAGPYPSDSWVLLAVSAAVLVMAAGFLYVHRARGH